MAGATSCFPRAEPATYHPEDEIRGQLGPLVESTRPLLAAYFFASSWISLTMAMTCWISGGSIISITFPCWMCSNQEGRQISSLLLCFVHEQSPSARAVVQCGTSRHDRTRSDAWPPDLLHEVWLGIYATRCRNYEGCPSEAVG